MEQIHKPIDIKLDFNYIHTCHINVMDTWGGIHPVHDILSVAYYPTQKEYTVVFLDNSAAGVLPEELLRAAVVSPGDPGTPGWNPDSNPSGNADKKPQSEEKLVFIPIAGVRDDLKDSKAVVKSENGVLEMPVSEIHSVIWSPKTPTLYQVDRNDGMIFNSTIDALLEAGVIKPGDPGTPGWNPESNPNSNSDEKPEADLWAKVQEKSWDEFCGYGFLRFVNTFLHIFGWAIVLNRENGIVTKVYPARVPFRGFAEKEMTRGYIQIAKFMEENASEIRKEAELG